MNKFLTLLVAFAIYLYSVYSHTKYWICDILFKNKLYNKIKSVDVWEDDEWKSFSLDEIRPLGIDVTLNDVVSITGCPVKVTTKENCYIVTQKEPTLAGHNILFWTRMDVPKYMCIEKLSSTQQDMSIYYSTPSVVNFIGPVSCKMLGSDEPVKIIDEITEEETGEVLGI